MSAPADDRRFGDVPRQAAGLAHRLHWRWLAERHARPGVVLAVLSLELALMMVALGAVAVLFHDPFIFPSIGPAAFALSFAALKPDSAPRNVVCGHAVAIVAGFIAVALFGMLGQAPDLNDLNWARAGASLVAVVLTAIFMLVLRVPHGPAAATTLIVALGLIGPSHYLDMMGAVVLLVIVAFAWNRFVGLPVPVWASARA